MEPPRSKRHGTPWRTALALLLALACGGGGNDAEPVPAPAGEAPRVVFLGTSLTAGYGLAPEQAFPALLQERIATAGLPHRVVNAGVSGETSAGALRRLDWLLRQPFDVLVLETGANDMLRGSDVVATRANIEAIVERVRSERPDARVVLLGMRAMPNLGALYSRGFTRMYEEVAREHDLPFVPFLLDGVAGEPGLNLGDGIHPNAEGQRRVAENVWKVLERELGR